MAMRIRVTRFRGEGTASRELTLQTRTATVGRSPDRDVFLDDPERVVSGQHAVIESRGNEIWITDLSRNGTFVNQPNEPLPPHQAVALAPSDRVLIGPFELRISLVDNAAPSPIPTMPPEDLEAGLPGLFGTGQSADILDLLGGGEQPRTGPGGGSQSRLRDQPFADAAALGSRLVGPARAAEPQSAPELTPVEHVCFRPPQPQVLPQVPPQAIPEGYDILQDIWTGPREPSPPPATPPTWSEMAPKDDQRPHTAPPSPATLRDFSDVPFPPAGPVGALVAPAPPPVPEPVYAPGTTPGLGTAPTPALGPASGPTPTLAQPIGPSPPEPAAPTQPLPAVGPTPRPLASGAMLVASSTPVGDLSRGGEAAVMAAFFRGLGLSDRMTIEYPEALMLEAGTLLRELVAGLIGIMMGRAQFKSELRLGVTTIRPVENNPFKFAVDPGDLLERLLLRPSPGFMPPLAAAHEAFDDIRAHEMAMTAGLQAALRALLAHFAPAELELRLGGPSRLENWLPMARKAHFWDLFTAAYAEVAADATEDFMRLFGDAFAAAYREQIDRLAGKRDGASAVNRSET